MGQRFGLGNSSVLCGLDCSDLGVQSWYLPGAGRFQNLCSMSGALVVMLEDWARPEPWTEPLLPGGPRVVGRETWLLVSPRVHFQESGQKLQDLASEVPESHLHKLRSPRPAQLQDRGASSWRGSGCHMCTSWMGRN